MSLVSNNPSNSYAPPPPGTGDSNAFAAQVAFLKTQAPPDPPPTPPPATPPTPPPADTSPHDLQALQGGKVTGDPPDQVTLPPGTTAANITQGNGGRDGKMLESLNDTKWHGTGLGDLAAQKYGFKDMKTLLADNSPQAAQAAAKILWAARASNNVKEADGADRPENDRNSDSLSATRNGDAFNGGTAAVFQNWVKDGRSISDQTVFKTDRTYADGGGRSAIETIGLHIADAFKKIAEIFCPPLKDLIQMAEDGAEKVRDKHVGDQHAAANDTKAIEQDGKNFGKDAAIFATNFIPGVGEIASGAARAVEMGVNLGKDAAEIGSKAGGKAAGAAGRGGEDVAETAGKAGSEAREIGQSGVQSLSQFQDELLDKLLGSDFMKKLAGLPKEATLEKKKEFIKQKIDEQVSGVLQQYGVPQQGSPVSQQDSGLEAQLAALRDDLKTLLTSLKQDLPSNSKAA
jgi:hypothetical protein